MRQALTPKSRGPKKNPGTHQQELEQLRREILRLNDALARAEMIIDVQKQWARCWDGPCRRARRGRIHNGRGSRIVGDDRHRSCL